MTRCCSTDRSSYAYERVPKSEVEELILEEVPDIDYTDIGGLTSSRSRPSATRSSCRSCTRTCSASTSCVRRRASCCTGRPAAARRSSRRPSRTRWPSRCSVSASGDEKATSYFLNIKGPELLNKYVGETERHIRLVFQRAREKASEGTPVIVFFDEMDSIFRTRGSGVSSDVENTIVPQLLSEIDGVEGLQNVIVIGASNREDMIDPAILRPGRLDVKIKIERPDAEAARDIFSKYIVTGHPHPRRRPRRARRRRRRHGRRDDPAHGRADVHRVGGEPLPRGHLRQRRQGDAVLQGLQLGRDDPEHRRPREEDGDQGPVDDRTDAGCGCSTCWPRASTSSARTRTCPNTTNPDDWARISGKKGERIVYIRTLVSGARAPTPGARSTRSAIPGQYL